MVHIKYVQEVLDHTSHKLNFFNFKEFSFHIQKLFKNINLAVINL